MAFTLLTRLLSYIGGNKTNTTKTSAAAPPRAATAEHTVRACGVDFSRKADIPERRTSLPHTRTKNIGKLVDIGLRDGFSDGLYRHIGHLVINGNYEGCASDAYYAMRDHPNKKEITGYDRVEFETLASLIGASSKYKRSVMLAKSQYRTKEEFYNEFVRLQKADDSSLDARKARQTYARLKKGYESKVMDFLIKEMANAHYKRLQSEGKTPSKSLEWFYAAFTQKIMDYEQKALQALCRLRERYEAEGKIIKLDEYVRRKTYARFEEAARISKEYPGFVDYLNHLLKETPNENRAATYYKTQAGEFDTALLKSWAFERRRMAA